MNTYAVVYQIGKVASTSIVATLGDLPQVTAVQSHFLGEAALSEIVPSITSPDVSQYFFRHQLGQFVANMQITRQINLIRAGKLNQRLLLISLARDPVEWIRSSLVQDIEGYFPILRVVAEQKALPCSNDSEMVRNSLGLVLQSAADLLERHGGLDAGLAKLGLGADPFFKGTLFESLPASQRIFRLFLRPFDWFQRHFEKALKLSVHEMERKDGMLCHRDATGDFVILRYEEMTKILPPYLESLGLPKISEFRRENESGNKLFALEVAECIGGDMGKGLAALCRDTSYARSFGYQLGPQNKA